MIDRAQLLALEPGEEPHQGGMRAYRPHPDPRYAFRSRVLYFSKRYPEGKLTVCVNREEIEDMLCDPWEMASERLEDSYAARSA